MKIWNTGLKPVVIGKTKEGFPLVIHPGKSAEISDSIAKELMKKNQCLTGSTEEKKEKKTRNEKEI